MSSSVLKLLSNLNEGFQRVIRFQFYNQDKYYEQADILVNRLMKEAELLKVDDYTAYFKVNNNVIEIWTENYPYAYGHPYAMRDHETGQRKYFHKVNNNWLGVKFSTRRKLRKFVRDNSTTAKTIKVLNDA